MTMIRLISLIALLPAAFLAAPAVAQSAPSLRASASISSDIVTLGDLVADAGPLADRAIFRAPDLGQTGTVSAVAILDAAKAQGLHHIASNGISEVSVTRASRLVDAGELRAHVSVALALSAGFDDPEALRPDISPVHLPVEADGAIHISDASWNETDKTFRATLTVRRIDGRDERRELAGPATETSAVIALRRDVSRGSVITPNDVEVLRVARNEAKIGALDTLDEAVGKEARRALREGHSLKGSDLEEPTLVKGSSPVTVVVKSGAMTLTATAQALRDGKLGDTIQVMNIQSKRVLQAVVTGPSEVAVNPPRTLVTAAK